MHYLFQNIYFINNIDPFISRFFYKVKCLPQRINEILFPLSLPKIVLKTVFCNIFIKTYKSLSFTILKKMVFTKHSFDVSYLRSHDRHH